MLRNHFIQTGNSRYGVPFEFHRGYNTSQTDVTRVEFYIGAKIFIDNMFGQRHVASMQNVKVVALEFSHFDCVDPTFGVISSVDGFSYDLPDDPPRELTTTTTSTSTTTTTTTTTTTPTTTTTTTTPKTTTTTTTPTTTTTTTTPKTTTTTTTPTTTTTTTTTTPTTTSTTTKPTTTTTTPKTSTTTTKRTTTNTATTPTTATTAPKKTTTTTIPTTTTTTTTPTTTSTTTKRTTTTTATTPTTTTTTTTPMTTSGTSTPSTEETGEIVVFKTTPGSPVAANLDDKRASKNIKLAGWSLWSTYYGFFTGSLLATLFLIISSYSCRHVFFRSWYDAMNLRYNGGASGPQKHKKGLTSKRKAGRKKFKKGSSASALPSSHHPKTSARGKNLSTGLTTISGGSEYSTGKISKLV